MIPADGVYRLRVSIPKGTTNRYTVVATVNSTLELEGAAPPLLLDGVSGALGHLASHQFNRLFAGAARQGSFPDGTLAELDRLVDEQRRAAGPRFHRLVSRFHAVLLEASGNSYLQKHLSLVRMAEEVFRPSYGLTAEAALDTVGAHAAVVNCLRQRAAKEAEKHIRTYLAQQLDIMIQQERQPQ